MKKPEISVIMAAYNHSKFVNQAIDSVLNQTGVDFEFLISDDGSSDNTAQIIASRRDARIKFYSNRTNRGACIVVNELICKASGEFIALINSDDYWPDKDKLKCQIDFMRLHPEIGACFGKAQFIDTNNCIIPKSELSFGDFFDVENRSQSDWLRRFFDLGNCICHPTMLIRKSCYDDIGLYDNRLRQLPDFDMWIRLIKKYQVFIFDKPLINFRILPGENAHASTPTNIIRLFNEDYLIKQKFFDNVSERWLQNAFSDLLTIKHIPSNVHLDIEKTLLYFSDISTTKKYHCLIGLYKLYILLNSEPHNRILNRDYGISDLWFQTKMGIINALA